MSRLIVVENHVRSMVRNVAVALIVALASWLLPTGFAHSADLGPQELFELGGIGEERLAELVNGELWQASGNDILRRMLYRMAKDVRPADMESWSLGDVDLERIASDPGAYRMQVFQLDGQVLLVEAYPLSSESDESVDFASIWRCRMKVDGHERPIDVFTARVPEAWSVGKPIDERAAARAFFLKTSQLDGTGPVAFFLADRMAWYPPTYLGRLGMDVGLLDDVLVEAPPKRNPDGSLPEINWTARQLTDSDHECFYEMLEAVGSAEEGQLGRWAQQELSERGEASFPVVPLFNHPQTQQGQLFELTGVARRIIPVRVGEREVRDRFGVREYYQVYLFTEDSLNNPIVFCLRELPEGLPMGDGPGFGERLSVAGFFLKTWAYPTLVVSADGKTQKQLAPLLIGKTAVWYPVQEPTGLSPMLRAIGTGVLILILGVVWWIFRQFGRGDREFEQRVRRRKPPEVSTMDWNAIDSSDEGV